MNAERASRVKGAYISAQLCIDYRYLIQQITSLSSGQKLKNQFKVCM